MTDSGLRVEVTHAGGRCLVVLGGEIDLANANDVQALTVQALSDCPDHSTQGVLDLCTTDQAKPIRSARRASKSGIASSPRADCQQVGELACLSGLATFVDARADL